MSVGKIFLFSAKTLFWLVVIFAVGYCSWRGVVDYHEVVRSDAIQDGKIAKENGRSIQENPYFSDEKRELWRQGWRSGKVITE